MSQEPIPYPDLPDPLMLKNGRKVTTAAIWWNQRRPEIVEDFSREIYGRVPANTPKVNWEVVQHDEGNERCRTGYNQGARGPRRQFSVSAHHRRYRADTDDSGQRDRSGAGDDGVRFRLRNSRRAW